MKLSVCENRKIPCSHEQRKALKAFEDAYCGKSAKSRIFDWRHQEVWAKNHVGVIQVPGLTLEILPKIDKHHQDEDERERLLAQHNLLYMLSFTRKLPFEERDLAALKLQKMPLMEILIRLFANRLLEELRRGVDHAYVQREENLPAVKGKILLNRHLTLNSAHKERFYVGFDEFLDDTPLNRIIKATCRRLLALSANSETQRLLLEGTAIFDEVSDIIPTHHFDQVHLHRNNERFQALLDFCRIVWHGQSPNPSAGDSHTFSLLFPMEQLFEEFIARFIRRHATSLGLWRDDIRIQSEGCSRYLLQEEQSKRSRFKLLPDLLLKEGTGVRLILDTKWKCLKSDDEDVKNGVSQADMYQMYAYSTRFDCNDVVLLYPDTGDVAPKTYCLFGDEEKRIRVAVINLNRDLKKDMINFKCDIKQIMHCNLPGRRTSRIL
jgi:5-methylcytosine-specific restriction enzyme subunit McrC